MLRNRPPLAGTPSSPRPSRARHAGRRAGSLLVALAAACDLVAPLAAPAQAAGRTYEVAPGADLRQALERLRPGDTLLMAPGQYRTGLVAPNVTRATAEAPIKIMAKDPARRPVIVGGLYLFSPDFWQLWGISAVSTKAGTSALHLQGGTGWQVRGGEYWGASATGWYANVVIGGRDGTPSKFWFLDNCVHHAGNSTRNNTDHNIYVNFKGGPKTGGTIARNLIFGHPNGFGVKLGDGGAAGAVGPWGVRVMQNTIADGAMQVIMHGDVRRNLVFGNIFAMSREGGGAAPRTVALYTHGLVGDGNYFGHNYVWRIDQMVYDLSKRVIQGVDNGVRPDPGFQSPGSCSGWRPTYEKATHYGRYGDLKWPTW